MQRCDEYRQFLDDRTNDRAYATILRLSVVCDAKTDVNCG